MNKKRRLVLRLKGIYFNQIIQGQKPEEYRLVTPYWIKRLRAREYDEIELTLGYPPAGRNDLRTVLPWRGVTETIITHPHFGTEPVNVFAIKVLP